MKRPPYFSSPAYDAVEKRYWSYDYNNHLHAIFDAAAGLWKMVDRRTGAVVSAPAVDGGVMMPASPARVPPAPGKRVCVVDGQVVAPVPGRVATPPWVRGGRSPEVRERCCSDVARLREERRVVEEEWLRREGERPWWDTGGI